MIIAIIGGTAATIGCVVEYRLLLNIGNGVFAFTIIVNIFYAKRIFKIDFKTHLKGIKQVKIVHEIACKIRQEKKGYPIRIFLN